MYGNNILGVEGTAVNTSDATAVSDNIEQNIIAYGAKGKITGTLQSGNANIIVDTLTNPEYYFLNEFSNYSYQYGVSSFGYILNKSQINSLIPEGRKFTIIAVFSKANEQQYGYKYCYICVYPENANRCILSGDSTNGWSIRCYTSENSQVNFDLYTANTYNTSTTLDEWLSTLTSDSFTQSNVSSKSIRKTKFV